MENGKLFVERFIARYDREAVTTHWYRAFEFFLDHACFQGRADNVSQRVRDCAGQVLGSHFLGEDRDRIYRECADDNWVSVERELGEKIGKGKVGKRGDITMIVSALQYIDGIELRNIVAHSAAEIRQGRTIAHYKALQKLHSPHGIFSVGPKVAAFYLRDVVSLLGLADAVEPAAVFCLQPVDVWVQRVAERLGIVAPGTTGEVTQHAIAAMCRRENIVPMLFNQGAWYTGFFVLKQDNRPPALPVGATH